MPRHSWILLCATWLAVAACAEGSRRHSLVACNPPRDTVFHLAAANFLSSVDPPPHRFLVAVKADSTVPDGARQAMQDIGPTYIYPADSAGRWKVTTMLKSYGSAPTLLLNYRGSARPSPDSLVIRFDGQFVGGADDGKAIPVAATRFHCNNGMWEPDVTAAGTP